MAVSGSGDVTAPAPAWAQRLAARRLVAGDFLRDVLGLTMISGGKADIDADLKADGGSLRDITPTLLGISGIDCPKEMTGGDLRIAPVAK